jgi:hypothetical protein
VGRATELSIVALPVVACLGLYFGGPIVNRVILPPEARVAALSSGKPSSGNLSSGKPSTTGQLASTPTQPKPPPPKLSALASPPLALRPITVSSRAKVLPTAAALLRGRDLARLLYAQQLDPVWKTFRPGLRKEWKSYRAFQDYRAGGIRLYGAELRVLSEGVRRSQGVSYYTRTAIFERGPQKPWTLILGLDRAGNVAEFNIVAADALPGATDLRSASKGAVTSQGTVTRLARGN